MILYLYEYEMPTVSLTKEGIKQQTNSMMPPSYIFSVKNVKLSDLNKADCIYLIRPSDLLSYKIAKYSQKSGKFVICYSDDDLLNLPAENYLNKKRRRYFRKALEKSNILLTCSPRLAAKYKEYTIEKRSVVSDTTVSPDEITTHVYNNEVVKIVYAAGGSHKTLFEKYISPIIESLLKQIEYPVSFTFVGVHPDLPELDKKLSINYVPTKPLKEYREYMRKENFDIGLAPIYDDEFSKCKYFNKFFEYSINGIMGIYTRSEPYTYVVKDQYNGLLAGFDSNEWLKALVKAINDKEFRRNCVNNAQNETLANFTKKANEEKLLRDIPELQIFNAKASIVFSSFQFSWYKVLYGLQTAGAYCITSLENLKKEGLGALVEKIKNHFTYRKVYK